MTVQGSRAAWPVALVSMPFADADRPSIQIGLLKAIAGAAGFPVRTRHASLDLAARITLPDYRALSEHRGRMIGDWLFSPAAFGAAAPDPDARLLTDFAADLPQLAATPEEVRARLLHLRDHEIPAFLDQLEADPEWDGVRVVGFSSTFQQNTASFALARRLKARYPGLVTVFGGANFDGEMGSEYVRAVDGVDFAVIGAGDVAFPRLLCALADGADPGAVPGVARLVAGRAVVTPPAAAPPDLDRLPDPDYEEYFARAERLGLLPRAARHTVWIPFESSRGCWWGAKHHCTFCGLNGTSMRFHAKSADRVLSELAGQARRYQSFRFEAVDNILDPGFLTTLLPAIVDSAADYDLFYELKANLSRAQIRLLAQAGVRRIQPGLESLSSRLLQLMRKGVRAAQNVNLLRWASYYGVDVAWNLLWGFPGETEQDFRAQAATMPHLVHLQPPGTADRIWLERFSPLFTSTAAAAAGAPEPERSYRYVYPDQVDLRRAAYFFDWPAAGGLPEEAYAGVRHEVSRWQELWRTGRRPALTYRSAPGLLRISDRRRHGHEGAYTFPDPVAAIYLACSERPTTAAAVHDRLGLDLPVSAVREAFEEFERRGLMFLDGTLAVALALPATPGR